MSVEPQQVDYFSSRVHGGTPGGGRVSVPASTITGWTISAGVHGTGGSSAFAPGTRAHWGGRKKKKKKEESTRATGQKGGCVARAALEMAPDLTQDVWKEGLGPAAKAFCKALLHKDPSTND